MIGNIKRYNGMSSGGSFNPDDMFDENNTATEENFIKLLEHEVYDSKYIGYKVVLSNSVDYNNGIWVIADVNHDSENTGQTNCYDLISQNCFHSLKFSNSGTWLNSQPYNWLNVTFNPGFSANFKEHMLILKYKSQDGWLTAGNIIVPSYKELGLGDSSYQYNEGVTYPIFTDSNSRIKYQSGTSTIRAWWTRSKYTNDTGYVWSVNRQGNASYTSASSSTSYYLAPLMRVS